jgi:hypothetical protein
MRAKSFFILAVPLLTLACSGEPQKPDVRQGDDALFAPDGVNVTPHASGCGKLSMSALTLRQGPSHAELYAALRNDGDTPACSPAFSVNVIDRAEQSLAMGVGGLLVTHFYRLTDGSGTIAACVAPGDVTMVAISDLPGDIALADVDRVEYWCNFWALQVVPIAGFSISDVQTITRDTGVAYAGALANGFDIAVSEPSVAVFPVNRRGRPLGVAMGRGRAELPPGGSWDFETDIVGEPGVAHAAFPAGGL